MIINAIGAISAAKTNFGMSKTNISKTQEFAGTPDYTKWPQDEKEREERKVKVIEQIEREIANFEAYLERAKYNAYIDKEGIRNEIKIRKNDILGLRCNAQEVLEKYNIAIPPAWWRYSPQGLKHRR